MPFSVLVLSSYDNCKCSDSTVNVNGNGVGSCSLSKEGAHYSNTIKAYELQEAGQDTIEANISLGFPSDLRDYGIGAQILRNLGYTKFKLITNNPKKIIGLKGYGLTINENINIKSEVNKYNERYISTKREKMHHLM